MLHTLRVPALVSAALGAGLVLAAAPAAAQRCEAPRLMLTVDRSSSMLGTLADGHTKWSAAVTAVDTLATRYESNIDFGVQPFPYPNACAPGVVTLPVGTHAAADIVDALGEPPPTAGNWTPLSQTLDAALAESALTDTTRSRTLVLITDGWQWCSPYDSSTRYDVVDSVIALRDAGVTVYVVGFGGGVDSLALNRSAVAAGTALPGCDPTLSDPAATNHCYMQADSLIELSAALDSIASDITEEVCDGLDNDCDGSVDEGFDVDSDGVTTCAGDCDDLSETTYPGASELCNSVDDDCDGVVDPQCSCNDGESRGCGSDVGACTAGVESCIDGEWTACEGEVTSVDELCNGVDDDCDGDVDDGADASCAADELCLDGACQPIHTDDPTDMPVEDDPTDTTDDDTDGGTTRPGSDGPGCMCSAPGQQSGSPLLAFATLGLLGLIAARRKR